MPSFIKSILFILTPAFLVAWAFKGFSGDFILSSLNISIAAFEVAVMTNQRLVKSAAPVWQYVVSTAIIFDLIASMVLFSFRLANPHLALVGVDFHALIGQLSGNFFIGAAAGYGAWRSNFSPSAFCSLKNRFKILSSNPVPEPLDPVARKTELIASNTVRFF